MVELSFVKSLTLCVLVELSDLLHQGYWVFNVIKLDWSSAWCWSQVVDVDVTDLLFECRFWDFAWISHQELSNLFDVPFWQSFSHAVFFRGFQRISAIIEWNGVGDARFIIDIKDIIILTCLKIRIPMVVLFGSTCSTGSLSGVLCDNIANFNPLTSLPHVSLWIQTVSEDSDFAFLLAI